MKNWGAWETVRRQVALCGRVVNRQDKPLGGARVTITQAPREFKVRARSGTAEGSMPVNEQPGRDVTQTRPDGIYFFLDLPGGDYTIAAEDPHSNGRGKSSGKVSWDKKGSVRRAVADIKID